MTKRGFSRRQVLASVPAAMLLPSVVSCIPQLTSTEPIKIRVLVPQLQDSLVDTTPERIKALIDQLNGKSESVTYEMARLTVAAVDYADAVAVEASQAKTAPDLIVVNLGDVPALVDRGEILSLDRYVKDDRDVKLDDFYPAVLAANRYKGQLYALPYICSPLVVYYNPKLFSAAGLQPPAATWTWQQFLQTARALTKSGTSGGTGEQFGLIQAPGAPPVLAYIWQNGGDVVDVDGRIVLDQPAAVEAIQFMGGLTTIEKVTPSLSSLGSRSIEDLILKDKVAMFMYYLSIGVFWRGEQGLSFEIAEVPQGKARVTTLAESAIAIGAKTKNPEAAYRALRSLVGEAEKTALIPARRSLVRDIRKVESRLSEQDVRVIASSLDYARGPIYENHHRVMAALRNLVEGPILSGANSAEGVASMGAIAISTLLQGKK